MNSITEKPVSASKIDSHIYRTFPNDLNSHDTIFGGVIMSTADRLALVVAERHSGHTCVTVSVDEVHFLNPAKGGDTLIFKAAVNRAWNSSMEIGIQVQAENSKTGTTKHILSAYFTFVAVDANNKPVSIPGIKPESSEEHMRFKEAQFRREQRLKSGELRKKLYA